MKQWHRHHFECDAGKDFFAFQEVCAESRVCPEASQSVVVTANYVVFGWVQVGEFDQLNWKVINEVVKKSQVSCPCPARNKC